MTTLNSAALEAAAKAAGIGNHTANKAIAAYLAALLASPAVPDGYVLVPREPNDVLLDFLDMNMMVEDAGTLWRDILDLIKQVAPAAPKPPTQGWPPIEAKPLAWNEYEREGDIDEWDAETSFGTFYSVRRHASYFEALYDSTPMEGQHQSPDDAKISCQEDYSARLNAALPTPPAVEGE